MIAFWRRGLLSTNSVQFIFPKTTVAVEACSDVGGVINCGYVESLASRALAAREGGLWPAGAVLRAHHCLVCRWLSSSPTVVRHKSCRESHNSAILAQTVFGVQSALQTSPFPLSTQPG